MYEWKLHQLITVPGDPVPKARPRFGKRGRFVKAYTPEKTVNYESRVSLFSPKRITLLPVRTDIKVIFARPKRLMGKKHPDGLIPHDKRPDLDNVIKSVLDGMEGRLYKNDGQVTTINSSKFYAEKATPKKSRVEVELYVLKTNEPTNKENNEDKNPADLASSTEGAGRSRSNGTMDT